MNDHSIAMVQGIIEGIREYPPVSSSRHQVLAGELPGFILHHILVVPGYKEGGPAENCAS